MKRDRPDREGSIRALTPALRDRLEELTRNTVIADDDIIEGDFSGELGITPKRWRALCDESRELLLGADSAKRNGDHAYAAKLWLRLRPLNMLIRALAALPPDGA